MINYFRKAFFSKVLISLCLATFFGVPMVHADDAGIPKFSLKLGSGFQEGMEIKPGDSYSFSLDLTMVDQAKGDFFLSFYHSMGDLIADVSEDDELNISNWVIFPDGEEYSLDAVANPGDAVSIPVRIEIPEGVSPGDYRGAISAKYVKDTEAFGGVSGASLTTAVGVKFSFSIPGERVHNLIFDDLSFASYVQGEGDFEFVQLGIGYTPEGNTSIIPMVRVTAVDLFGKQVLDEEIVLEEIFPGKNYAHGVNLENLPKKYGLYDITVELLYTPKIESDGEVEPISVGKKVVRVSLFPKAVVYGVMALFLILILLFFFKGRKRAGLKKNAKMYVVKEGDTLQSVSQKFKCDAKDVVYLNKLKSPFLLQPGDKILIPLK